ncbi:MAG: hypothetical protein QXJ59_06910 [Thermofilaceae archaeon]
MGLYYTQLTVPANRKAATTLPVEGEAVTRVEVRFPPGPQYLTGVRISWGAVQIFPRPAGAYVFGDDEIVFDDMYFQLIEQPTVLTIEGINYDQVYPHTVYIRVKTYEKREEPVSRLAAALSRFFGR